MYLSAWVWHTIIETQPPHMGIFLNKQAPNILFPRYTCFQRWIVSAWRYDKVIEKRGRLDLRDVLFFALCHCTDRHGNQHFKCTIVKNRYHQCVSSLGKTPPLSHTTPHVPQAETFSLKRGFYINCGKVG